VKKNLFIFFILTGYFSVAQVEGHWLSDKALLDCVKGDTIQIIKTKYKNTFYQWGQPSFGMQFNKDGTFSEFYTVMCSTESSPLVYSGERWKMENDPDGKKTVLIYGEKRTVRFKIISKKGKKVSLIVI
jgi:hypothetical protein